MNRSPSALRPLRLVAALLLALAAGVATGAAPAPNAAPAAAPAGKLVVHFFDIGQGDAYLIVSPAGKTVLIDGGPPGFEPKLVARVKELVKGPLDLVILTHPHADHLAGIADVVQAVGAKRYLESGFDHPSAGYKRLLEVMGKEVEQKLFTADPGKPQDLIGIGLGEGVKLWLLWPRIGPRGEKVEEFLQGTRSDVNSNSVVAKLVYGKTAFLLMGDAEPDTEDYLLQKNIDFTSTVLKVGHHGGRHSSTAAFLARVKPKAALISCATGNDYGHPGAATLTRLAEVGAHVFRTDQDGEITAVSDGTTVRISSERHTEGSTPLRFEGETQPAVATGPILAGERRASQSTLEDQARYGKRPKGATDAATEATARPHAVPDAGVQVAPVKAVVPLDVQERYPVPVGGGQLRYLASRRSKVFHQANCGAVATIKEANLLTFSSRAEAAKGRTPAADCNP
ncbi:MAG: ComEC/Rec2 family competence protein [Myxococcaceae bacterium]